jgi:hypothetical protein
MSAVINAAGINRWEPWQLDAVLENSEPLQPWLSTTFFPREKYFETQTVEFDVVDANLPRRAPFTSPLNPGVSTRIRGYSTRSIAPGYIKLDDLVQPEDHAYVRMPGEAYGGTMTPMQRFDLRFAQYVKGHVDRLDTTEEWMAAQILLNGALTMQGPDIEDRVVSFNRATSLYLNLNGAATAWDQTAADPLLDIQTQSLLVRQLSFGGVVSDLIMSGATWDILKWNTKILTLVNKWYRYGKESTNVDISPRNDLYKPIMVGNLDGKYRIWTYDAFYEDDQGQRQQLIPDNYVIGIAPAQFGGTKYYGAIHDLQAQLKPMKFFQKNKVEFEPSGRRVVTASAPLLGPRRANATFVIRVK